MAKDWESKIPSISEWLTKINFPNSESYKIEDENKFSRLKKLHTITGISYLKPKRIKITQLINSYAKIKKNVTRYTWRVIPKSSSVPKLRARMKTQKDGIRWLTTKNINPANYKHIEIIPYLSNTYSSIFIINEKGIWGEIIKGHIWHLSFGVHKHKPNTFYHQNKQWNFDKNSKINNKIIKTIEKLQIKNPKIRNYCEKQLNAKFTKEGYIKGYFEIQITDKEVVFNDYNRLICGLIKNFQFATKRNNTKIKGKITSTGVTQGRVVKINNKNTNIKIKKDDIIVCQTITINDLPLIRKARGIITEQGNALSHAAIIVRELKKPYVANVKDAMKKLKDGDWVTVDADQGKIIIH